MTRIRDGARLEPKQALPGLPAGPRGGRYCKRLQFLGSVGTTPELLTPGSGKRLAGSGDGTMVQPLSKQTIIPFLTEIFERRGTEEYLGEPVTIGAHVLQAARFAQ